MVSSAVHSWPLVYQTCWIRESLLSSGPSVSCAGPMPERQPTVTQLASGTGPGRCWESGGTPYDSDPSVTLLSMTCGWLVASDDVFDKLQTPRWLSAPLLLPDSSAADELTKYSVPP